MLSDMSYNENIINRRNNEEVMIEETTLAPVIPVAKVIWCEHWDQLGTSFMGAVHIPTWFWNIEEDTYNKLTLNTDDISSMRYGLTEPVIGKEIVD